MSHKPIPDIISLLIKIQDSKQYLFNINHNQNITLPSTTLADYSWNETSNAFAKQILSIDPPNIAICRIFRLYCPYQKYVMNVIYEVTLLSDMLSNCNINQSSANGMQLQWMTYAEIINTVWISQKYWKCLFEPSSSLSSSSDDKSFVVYEMTKDETLITTSNTDAMHYEMICAANITEDDQNYLYRKFLRIVWPENLMSIDAFKIFCDIILSVPGDSAFTERLFKTTDVNCRNCLSFRDILYMLAAAHPSTPHDGSCLDIRTRYIFNYYDEGDKGYWDESDLKRVLREMSEKRFSECDLETKVLETRK